MATPVVTVASGGIAVTEVDNGLPVVESTTGGIAVTIVASGGLGVTYSGGGVVDPDARLAQVGNRCSIATTLHATATQIMSRKGHQNKVAVTSLRVGIPNWYILSGGSGEAGSGGIATFEASVEYPAGVYTRITFGGLDAGVTANNTTLISDEVAVAIPADTDYWIQIYAVFANRIVHTFQIEAAFGDRGVAGTSVTNSVMTTFANSSSIILPPVLILAEHSLPCVLAIGDSRCYGTGATGANASISGEIIPSLHGFLPYSNTGRHGINATTLSSSLSARRKEMAAYFSDVILQPGINDITAGGSDATLRTNLNSCLTALNLINPDVRVSLTTLSPVSTSTDSWATTVNQTTHATNAVRTAHNDWRRTVPAGYFACYETADAVESARNSGLWAVTGAAFGIASDSTHASNGGYAAIVASGAIDPNSFDYP
jgi:hypothetical protein